jgi:hypothetical protein
MELLSLLMSPRMASHGYRLRTGDTDTSTKVGAEIHHISVTSAEICSDLTDEYLCTLPRH